MAKKQRKSEHCLNCKTELGDSNYCPQCGQINHTKQVPLKAFIHDLLGDYLTFDSKFFRSFVPLVRRPGHLTNEYNSGRRVSYILPLRLYLFITILFFFVISLKGKLGVSYLDTPPEAKPVANRDSLAVLLADYDLPQHVSQRLITDIDRRYKLTTKKVRAPGPSYPDSLKDLFGTNGLALPASAESTLVAAISNNFEIRNRKRRNRRNDEDDLEELRDLISTSPFELDSIQRSQIVTLIDSGYRIRYESLTSGPNIELTGGENSGWDFNVNNAPVDSLEAGIVKSFFLKARHLARQGAKGGRLFWREVLNNIPKVMFLILPIFALILKLLYVRKKIYYINHLIFSLHAHSIIFLYLLLAILFPVWYIITFTVLGIWWHLYFSMRNVYKQSRFLTALKLNTLLFVYFFPLVFGFGLLSVLAVINV